MTTITSLPPSNSIATKRLFLDKLYQDSRLQAIEKIRCQRSLKYWLWGDGIRHDGYVLTVDPHDKEHPIKHFPKIGYLEFLADLWLKEPLLLIPKSRQLMVTWFFSACYLWDTQFNYGRYTYFQSKKEEDSDYIVRDRAGFILKNEPSFLWPDKFNPEKHISYCSITFESLNSSIKGIPEGGDQIRSRVPSGLFSDESAFQPEFEDAVTAMKPCITGGGRFTAVSSAEPSFFQELVEDK